MTHTWPDVLSALVARTDLTTEQAEWAMGQILSGVATPAQVAGFAVGLRSKGEALVEIDGLLTAMYAHATPLEIPGRALDIVGTGGDRSNSVNISSMAAIVAAGAGAPVVKHGNRSASSQAGSADVLEVLGVRLDLTPEQVAAVYEKAGITFAFAPVFHGAMRHTGQARRELGIGTVFNFLGPLANPARPAAQAIGCADARMAPLMAGVFVERGVDAWVFRGDDGLDEITTTGSTTVYRAHDGFLQTTVLDPTALGVPLATEADLKGGDKEHNADVVRRLLAGERGPVRDAVVLNAGAALAIHDTEGGEILAKIKAGMERAEAAIDSGAAAAKLQAWVDACTAV
ncbi:anthranilate phosphoribosyltransferase [Nocardioides sp.]|uniref:anthranilate phosphoribosyltransferase n=1 Tax=Nocardioides sp. TaxID=35761 RepID=UPI002BA9DE70|nr:anthranilate phosphoribosyltransferase [Nocardioides sp.]HSX66638.1 anthranilate phosphoribosyltransferase [Nocardioides sp.]